MPQFVPIADDVSGELGQVRCDHRAAPTDAETTPLVLLGGMTQTISSWSGQLRPLSETREVLVYEARGQGSTTLSVRDATVPRHVEDFARIIEALGLRTPIDLAGFSFGGRLSLAIAAEHPELVRRLVVTGVGAGQGVVGRSIIRGWRHALRTGDLEALAWVSLPDILGPAYLSKYHKMIEAMIKATITRNDYDGIVALFDQGLQQDPESPWRPLALAPRIRRPTLLVGGAHDRMASPEEIQTLAGPFADARVQTFPGSGHTVPIEEPQGWREAVLAFLDAPSP